MMRSRIRGRTSRIQLILNALNTINTRNTRTSTIFFLTIFLFCRGYKIRTTPYIPRGISNRSLSDSGTGENASAPTLFSNLHPDYSIEAPDTLNCERRYGLPYLSDFVESMRPYCEPHIGSQLSCFTNDLDKPRRDTFCMASNLALPPNSTNFELACQLRDWNSTDLDGSPKLTSFHEYASNTGPKNIFEEFVEIVQPNGEEIKCERDQAISHTIIVKRQSATNLWENLLEIFSYMLTMDALHLAKDSTGKPLFRPQDVETTQVVLLDDKERGSLLGLWHILAQKPLVRIAELKSTNTTCLGNVIIPLAGEANPLVHGALESLECSQSKTLDVFVQRVKKLFNVPKDRDLSGQLVITFIDRKFSRKLFDQHKQLSEVKGKYKDTEIKMVDFASLPLRDQISTVQNSDVLVGVHGTGLAHAMFLSRGAALVEILPEPYEHRGFRNLAKLSGVQYFSTRAKVEAPAENNSTSDWRQSDVKMEESKFLEVMDAAIKSVLHRGRLNIEI